MAHILDTMPTPTRDTHASRLDALTTLRWFAAFGVFLFHMRNMVTFPEWMMWLVTYGNYGVTFFFVLSGFVLTWSWRPATPVRAFYWRRFARIWPLHMVALLVAIPVFYRPDLVSDAAWIKPLDWGVLLLSVLVIQGWWLDPVIKFSGNPAAWTLTVEALFYALHPAIIRGFRGLRRNAALIALVVLIGLALGTRLMSVLLPAQVGPVWSSPIGYLPSFIAGMLVGWAMRAGWRLRMPISVASLLLLGGLFAAHTVARSGPMGATLAPFTPELVVLLCCVLIAAAATAEADGRVRILRWRPLVALGEWSFAFYLVHATIMYAAMEVFGRQLGSMRLTAMWSIIILTIAIALSAALHLWVEKPVERRLRAWQDRRLQAPATAPAAAA